MVKGPALAGSPETTATRAPFGRAGGAGPQVSPLVLALSAGAMDADDMVSVRDWSAAAPVSRSVVRSERPPQPSARMTAAKDMNVSRMVRSSGDAAQQVPAGQFPHGTERCA